MGKIRVKTFGDEELERLQKQEEEKRKEAKISAAKSVSKESAEKKATEEVKADNTDAETVVNTETIKEEKSTDKKSKKEPNAAKSPKGMFHSKKYQSLADTFDKTKLYSLSEGLDLLEKLQRKVFDETVELHINTISSGINGNVVLPHGTGKKTKVAIATDALIESIEKGKIDFDILIAEPTMMGKLAKVAKVLGPKGLMPNPKNGTITSNPTEAAKKYEGGQINFKTEAKTPIIHLNVGKMSFGKEKLTQNIESMLTAIKKSNIVNITLKSTMSPGIKIKI